MIELPLQPTRAESPAGYPAQPFEHLDALWIQIAGSICNLRCTHCFVSCGPDAEAHALMSRTEVAWRVAEGLALGVREVYFTGGEPFLHPDLLALLDDTLRHLPATVLTNGTLFTARRVAELRALSEAARYTLEIRVSLDSWSAEVHDRIRGAGSFERVIAALSDLAASGLLPIVTATLVADEDPAVTRERYVALLKSAGIDRPRLKLLPLFRLGREIERSRGYRADESLAGMPQGDLDTHVLQCGRSRAVTSRGVFVCPLLVDEPVAHMGTTLAATLRPYELRHGACSTCYATGMTCANG